MSTMQACLSSLTKDRRAEHLFDTKTAAAAVECHPRKFGDWWERTKRKLRALAKVLPGPLAAEIAVIFAEAEMERQAELEAAQRHPAA